MSRAALSAGLSLLWLTESNANDDDVEADYQFAVSQAVASRVDDFGDAIDAFASEEA
jgi:hypothetical protein